MDDIYTVLTFKNHKEFEMYKNAVNWKDHNIALRFNATDWKENKRLDNCKLTVIIKTELPLPTGTLIARDKHENKIEIQVSSGRKVVVEDNVNI